MASVLSIEAQDSKTWLENVSSEPPGPHTNLRPVAISYGLSWKGRMNAGQMQFVLTEPYPDVYLAKASGQSVGLPRALFPYNFSGSSQTNATTLKPLTFNFSDKMKAKSYNYSLLFQPNQMVSHTNLTDLKTGKKTPYHRVYRFEKDSARDLMSSILYLRSQPLTPGQKISLITATFNKPYLTDFTVLCREQKVVNRKKYNSIKLDLNIKKINRDMTVEPYSKIEQATIWLSDDEFRLPLEFHGDIFVGYISAKMTSRKWL
ncbi:MAG: DUF3108 domain-containing protein [Verrucomicrobiales bacterium]|nr:DUF3108 domain-containing protein [Verrucomicrobiales bacterium]